MLVQIICQREIRETEDVLTASLCNRIESYNVVAAYEESDVPHGGDVQGDRVRS